MKCDLYHKVICIISQLFNTLTLYLFTILTGAGGPQTLRILKTGRKTIPQLSSEACQPEIFITCKLMIIRKYDNIDCGEIDDMDQHNNCKVKQGIG